VQGVLTAVSTTNNAKAAWKDATIAEEKVIGQDGATLSSRRRSRRSGGQPSRQGTDAGEGPAPGQGAPVRR
jgi:hypothetical protein